LHIRNMTPLPLLPAFSPAALVGRACDVDGSAPSLQRNPAGTGTIEQQACGTGQGDAYERERSAERALFDLLYGGDERGDWTDFEREEERE
jgi:hypothetical protein